MTSFEDAFGDVRSILQAALPDTEWTGLTPFTTHPSWAEHRSLDDALHTLTRIHRARAAEIAPYLAQELERLGWSPRPHTTLAHGERSRRKPRQLLAFASIFPDLYVLDGTLSELDANASSHPDSSLSLTFESNNLTEQKPFAEHTEVPNLHHLDLSGRLLERNGEILSKSPLLDHVTHLSMRHSYLDDGCVDLILDRLDLAHLRSIDLAWTQGTRTPYLHDRLRSLQAPELTHLNLSGTFSGTEVIEPWRRLAENPAMSSLRSLGASSPSTREAALLALANSPHLTNLRQLSLGSCWLKTPASASILTSPNTRNLQHLLLNLARIKPAAFEALPEASFCDSLLSLDLSDVGLTHKLAIPLSKTPFTSLRSLILSSNTLTKKTVDALLSAPWLRSLKHLDVSRSYYRDEALLDVLRHELADTSCQLLT